MKLDQIIADWIKSGVVGAKEEHAIMTILPLLLAEHRAAEKLEDDESKAGQRHAVAFNAVEAAIKEIENGK